MQTYEISLDMKKAPGRIERTVVVRRGDADTQTIRAAIAAGGEPYTPKGAARLDIMHADGTWARCTATLSGPTVSCTMPNAALNGPGRCRAAHFVFTDGAKVESTEGFALVIEDNVDVNGTPGAQGYDSELEALKDAWRKFTERAERDEAARAEAEGRRAEAEAGRVKAETERKSKEAERASAEADRKAAETERKRAEDAREAAETARAQAEQARADAEAKRWEAETARKAEESKRAEAEAERKRAETARAEAEDARTAAETARAAAETARAEAETVRGTAEGERVKAEQARATAEQGRAAAETARAGAESERARAEQSRASEESKRAAAETERKKAEDGRKSAEAARASEESKRATAEDERKRAETERASAEQGRVQAETARADAETARADAESKRSQAESSRAEAEAARSTAEQGRASKEAERVAAEAARAGAETARVSAESSRSTAETARAEAETAREAAQAKNNADQALNNEQMKRLSPVILQAGQYDPSTLTPTVTGEPNRVYFVPMVAPAAIELYGATEAEVQAGNSYMEWMWVGGKWELMGQSEIKIKPITTDQVDAVFAGTHPTGDSVLNLTGLDYVRTKDAELLDGKADASHTHTAGDIASGTLDPARVPVLPTAKVDGLQAALDGKAAAAHRHPTADVDGLQAALDGKQPKGEYAASSHTHEVAEVTGLQAALDGKAAASHRHAAADIDGLVAAVGVVVVRTDKDYPDGWEDPNGFYVTLKDDTDPLYPAYYASQAIVLFRSGLAMWKNGGISVSGAIYLSGPVIGCTARFACDGSGSSGNGGTLTIYDGGFIKHVVDAGPSAACGPVSIDVNRMFAYFPNGNEVFLDVPVRYPYNNGGHRAFAVYWGYFNPDGRVIYRLDLGVNGIEGGSTKLSTDSSDSGLAGYDGLEPYKATGWRTDTGEAVVHF